MNRNPFVLLLLALAVCVAVAWGLPAGLDALKHSLAPGDATEQVVTPNANGQGKTSPETPGLVPSVSDIPSN